MFLKLINKALYICASMVYHPDDISYNLDIETGDFLSFVDWFFDGFFVDWMVQYRINKAKEQVSEAIRQVEDILRKLNDH